MRVGVRSRLAASSRPRSTPGPGAYTPAPLAGDKLSRPPTYSFGAPLYSPSVHRRLAVKQPRQSFASVQALGHPTVLEPDSALSAAAVAARRVREGDALRRAREAELERSGYVGIRGTGTGGYGSPFALPVSAGTAGRGAGVPSPVRERGSEEDEGDDAYSEDGEGEEAGEEEGEEEDGYSEDEG